MFDPMECYEKTPNKSVAADLEEREIMQYNQSDKKRYDSA